MFQIVPTMGGQTWVKNCAAGKSNLHLLPKLPNALKEEHIVVLWRVQTSEKYNGQLVPKRPVAVHLAECWDSSPISPAIQPQEHRKIKLRFQCQAQHYGQGE